MKRDWNRNNNKIKRFSKLSYKKWNCKNSKKQNCLKINHKEIPMLLVSFLDCHKVKKYLESSERLTKLKNCISL